MEMEKQVLVGSCRDKGTQWTLISRPCRVSSTMPNPCSLQIHLGSGFSTWPGRTGEGGVAASEPQVITQLVLPQTPACRCPLTNTVPAKEPLPGLSFGAFF